MTNHETDRRAQWASALWEAAEQNTIAEWICCDPIDPKHGLCVAGGKALEMLQALIVDDPQSYKPAPLTTVALELAAVSVPPPAPRADDQAALRDRIRRAVCEAEGFMWNTELLEPDEYGDVADAVLAVLPEPEVYPLAVEERDSYHRWLKEAETARDEARLQLSRVIGERNRLAAEVDNLLQQEADRIVAHCPDHGTADGVWMDCHCAVADDMRRNAVGPCVAGEQQNETPEAEAPVVAYRSRDSRSLYCTAHAGELFGLSYEPVTAEDLPDGGICTYPDCGRDVLAEPRP